MITNQYISPQSKFPPFVERGGRILIRKMFEYKIINDKVVVVDLPQPGHQPEYLTEENYRLWREQQTRILKSAAK